MKKLILIFVLLHFTWLLFGQEKSSHLDHYSYSFSWKLDSSQTALIGKRIGLNVTCLSYADIDDLINQKVNRVDLRESLASYADSTGIVTTIPTQSIKNFYLDASKKTKEVAVIVYKHRDLILHKVFILNGEINSETITKLIDGKKDRLIINGKKVIEEHISILGIMNSEAGLLEITDYYLQNLNIVNDNYAITSKLILSIENCIIDKLLVSNVDVLRISKSNIISFNKHLYGGLPHILILNSDIRLSDISRSKRENFSSLTIKDSNVYLSTPSFGNYSRISFDSNYILDLSGNSFHSNGSNVLGISGVIKGDRAKINIESNDFNGASVILSIPANEVFIENNSGLKSFKINCQIGDRFTFLNNELEKLIFLDNYLPELHMTVEPDQIINKLHIQVRADSLDRGQNSIDKTADINFYKSSLKVNSRNITYDASSLYDMSRTLRFKKLIEIYSRFYHHYQGTGDIEAANAVYRAIQQRYTLLYKHRHLTEGGIENNFRWRLNQLLEFYVLYGTSPTRALVISFYIVLIFSVFYFFFPSDWDKEPKQKLISNIRSAINKHEPETFQMIMRAVWLLALSMINAFTLSLNAFVTLGFGTIPTLGIARYVCIIQGFLGWFLLSLFSVALINQVIF